MNNTEYRIGFVKHASKRALTVLLCMLMLCTVMPGIVSSADDEQEPRIVSTVYPADDTVIADIIATASPYNADNTGKEDCTSALQRAIDDCAEAGGGTVFMPAGRYRLTGSISIKAFVTLQGDWQDPDTGTDYGTVIIADVESSDSINPALITIGGSAGAAGLTVWYPDQSIDNVKPYPYTFYVDGKGTGYMLQTVRNCTLLNSYRGIGCSAECAEGINEIHEMFNVENVKGTCLYRGLTSYNSADVDTVKTLVINAEYWADAGAAYNAPSAESIKEYTRKNLVALSLGDLEWPEFADIHVSDCLYGIRTEKGLRTAFCGSFYDLYIENCDYGIYCPDGTVSERMKQCGIGVCNGVISASELAVYNPGEDCILLTNVETEGKIKGNNIHTETASTDRYALDYNHTHAKPEGNLFVVSADTSGRTDASADVQAALDKASESGGIVYMPAGLYRFDGPVTVPAGVELRGSSSVPARCQAGSSRGTLIISYYGYLDENPDASALITLSGENAGVSGIRVSFFKNTPIDDSGNYKKTSPAVRISADGCYVVNSFFILSSDGVVLENCSGIYLKKNVGCCYESFIKSESCSDVFIEGCLQNGNAVPRNGYSEFGIADLDGTMSEDYIFDYLYIPLTRKHTDFIVLENSGNVTVFNTFIYGGRCYLSSSDSSALICNVGCDGNAKDSYFFNMSGGEITIINAMRSTSDGSNGMYSHKTDGNTKLKIYNRLPMDIQYREYTVFENIGIGEIEKSDMRTYLLQPFYHLYEFFGRLYMIIF